MVERQAIDPYMVGYVCTRGADFYSAIQIDKAGYKPAPRDHTASPASGMLSRRSRVSMVGNMLTPLLRREH
ncbi:MAG TPA: hypothetical protein VFW73_02635, partial [Lacipirellulaceae bacterium]|nr:hypothetical protein [Lacipirellulaceae bacterium]